MSDMYQYPVFFECDSLGTEHFKKKIHKYFLIRRKSGGGDCEPPKRVADQIYSIAFKHEKDQQKVLQRSKHDVEGLVFTVRDSLETRTSSSNIPSSESKGPHLISASTSPPSGETCELQLDSYLLRYLKECPKAEKELERKLRSVPCSAQLYPEDGKILVRSLAQPGAVDEVRDLKAEVRKIFDGYKCHYEMENRKIKVLLKSCSSDQATDEVKVYSEVGMAVVVGELSQVNARLMEVEDSHVKLGSRLSEKQTSVRRLGEAKLRLLWNEIEHSLGQEVPEVRVTQGGPGQLLLEGSVDDILKAGVIISKTENLVLERKVSDLSPHFATFLRKAYGQPGMLGDFLQVDDKLEIELQDTELRLFALSADILDNTEKTLRDEIKEVSVDVPNCSTVPSELREKLKSKTSELNREQYRAEVVFGSDSTLRLLGCTKDVEELREIITQFILVQSNPSSKVTDFSNSQDPFGQDSVTFDPSGEVKYARSPTGKYETPSFNNLASLSLSDANTVASYNLSDGLQVLVCHGDITKLDADALVNAANEDLDHGGGVAQALSKAGGPQVQKESKDLVKRCGKIPTGDVVVTTGGNLNCKALLHAVGPAAGSAGEGARVLLEKTVQSALNLAESKKFQSIAMPCISSGSFGVPVNVCSEAIVTAVKRFGSQGGRSLSSITLIDNREEVVRAMQEACKRLLHGTSRENSSPRNFVAADRSSRDTDAGAPGDGVRVEIIIGTIETQQVDAVVSPMVGHDPLSTRVGNTLYEMVGPQLTSWFREEAGEETQPGDAVLVEGLPELLSNSVFFLNLLPWNDDEDGVAVQVLRLGISNILNSCENRGFRSVALPLLGSGIALGFPDSVVDRVLHEEILKFEQSRDNRTSLWVRIVIHPNDGEFCEDFDSAQEPFQPKRLSEDEDQSHHESTTKRIILLGKTGAGKSNLANTIFGEKLFTTNHSPNSGTSKCQAETRSVNGRSITLIDTPGFFDVNRSEEDMKPEIVRCITECAPGPHAFLIVLKVEKFTEHERAVFTKICKYFSEDALKYAVIVFTHGDQLPKGVTIEEFVSQNENLSDLVKKCGGRCHVIDNKYWKNKMQTNYRSNHLQVEDLLKTIDKMVMGNNGDYYKNEMLQVVEKEIQKEEEQIRKSSGNMPVTEIRKQAKTRVSDRFLISLAGTATGALLGAFFGVAAMVGFAITALRNSAALLRLLKRLPALGGAAAGAAGCSEVAGLAAAGVVVGVTTAGAATAGGVMGGVIGHDAAKEAETPLEAAEMAASAVLNKGKDFLKLP